VTVERKPLLEVKNLKTWFYTPDGIVKAVNGVSFTLNEGEALGLVGESGCGKSVSAMSLMRLIPTPPGRIVEGEVIFDGKDLLNDLKDEFEMAVLLITHDLGVVAEVADRVVVMYAGKIAETADVVDLFEHPLHPYTKALFRSLPSLESRKETLEVIPGSVPSPLAFPSGCRFRTRCQISRPECATFDPELLELRPGHFVACPFTSDTGRSAEAGR
jgi:oligopeptide/dipeptide ABC transporter ATP-binding protein